MKYGQFATLAAPRRVVVSISVSAIVIIAGPPREPPTVRILASHASLRPRPPVGLHFLETDEVKRRRRRRRWSHLATSGVVKYFVGRSLTRYRRRHFLRRRRLRRRDSRASERRAKRNSTSTACIWDWEPDRAKRPQSMAGASGLGTDRRSD